MPSRGEINAARPRAHVPPAATMSALATSRRSGRPSPWSSRCGAAGPPRRCVCCQGVLCHTWGSWRSCAAAVCGHAAGGRAQRAQAWRRGPACRRKSSGGGSRPLLSAAQPSARRPRQEAAPNAPKLKSRCNTADHGCPAALPPPLRSTGGVSPGRGARAGRGPHPGAPGLQRNRGGRDPHLFDTRVSVTPTSPPTRAQNAPTFLHTHLILETHTHPLLPHPLPTLSLLELLQPPDRVFPGGHWRVIRRLPGAGRGQRAHHEAGSVVPRAATPAPRPWAGCRVPEHAQVCRRRVRVLHPTHAERVHERRRDGLPGGPPGSCSST